MEIVAYLKKRPLFLLAVIFVLGFLLRNINLPNNLFFIWEQGRDLSQAQDIATFRHLTLIGPKAGLEGLFHGAFYYYFLAVFYLLTQGNPGQIIFVFTALNAITILVMYFIGRELFKDKIYVFAGSILTAVSFNIIVYGRWLSNASASILIVSLFFYSLVKLVKTKKPTWYIPTFFFIGLLAHFEILNFLYGLFLTAIAVFLWRIRLQSRSFFMGCCVLLLMLSPFILFEIRHAFLMSKGVLGHFTGSAVRSFNLLLSVNSYAGGLFDEIANTLMPQYKVAALVLFFVLMLFAFVGNSAKKDQKKLLYFLILSLLWNLPLVFLLKEKPLMHFYAGSSVFIILLFCFLLETSEKYLKRNLVVAILSILIIVNISYTINSLKKNENLFFKATNKDLLYKDQLDMLDFIFTNSHETFTIDYFTIPYFRNEGWKYLYEWYGKKKYPDAFDGNKNQRAQLLYLIIEPYNSDPKNSLDVFWVDKWLTDYDKVSVLVKRKKVGNLEVQVRKLKP